MQIALGQLNELHSVLMQGEEASSVAAFRKAVAKQPEPPSRRYRFELYMLATKFQKQLPIDQLFEK